MRTPEETKRILDASFLWDGHSVYFSYNDFGSIGEGRLYTDSPALMGGLLADYDAALADGHSPRDASVFS